MSKINSVPAGCELENFKVSENEALPEREKIFKPSLVLLTTAGPKFGEQDQSFTTCSAQRELRS